MVEIRHVNAATAVAFSICNSLIASKRQHVKPLRGQWQAAAAAVRDIERQRKSGTLPPDTRYQFNVDLETQPTPQLLIELLRGQIFERLSVVGRPLRLTVTLSETIELLREAIGKRNGLIESYKATGLVNDAAFYRYILGLPLGDSHVNNDYPATLDAISLYTDDCIFFANLLCGDLHTHGTLLVARLKKVSKEAPPRVHEVSFEKAEQLGLMPACELYADWLDDGTATAKSTSKPPLVSSE